MTCNIKNLRPPNVVRGFLNSVLHVIGKKHMVLPYPLSELPCNHGKQ